MHPALGATTIPDIGKSQRDCQFVFVAEHSTRYIRGHLSRRSRAGNGEAKARRTFKKRSLLPAEVSSGNSFHTPDKHDELQISDIVSGEKDQNSFRSCKAKITIPFGNADFDCFHARSGTVRGSDRMLIHHWTYIFGEMMFGIPRSSINPMAEIWIPDAFSNDASFQGMLAYAAAHLAHLRRQDSGAEYTIHKIEAISSIQKLLNDTTAALSDSAISAILRQISIEDRFGSPTTADLHRTGLFNIIEKRGGLMSLRTSWRLEFLLYWYLITSRPKFYLQDLRHQDSSGHCTGCKYALRLSHSKLLRDQFAEVFRFLHELKVLTQEGSGSGIPVFIVGMDPANSLLRLVKSRVDSSRVLTHEMVGETCRLASLFYITSVKADALRLGTNDMEALRSTISDTRLAWEYSSETLLWVLLRGKGPGLENPRRAQMVQSFMEVAKLLPEHSWSVLKDLLIAFLWGDTQDVVTMYEELLLLVRGMMGNFDTQLE
ncbi:hypothetical protein V1525DRAFT_400690 [Lipomyces kononenkoae]|uniref:Uncharacterized protein n=1 Tax=Lipomyces kononenkoae TaxID=34357 RepID=A0ACC3T3J8_LIPKO